MNSTTGRVALVAGASGGIGRAVARRLAASRITVYMGHYRNGAAAQSLADEIAKSGGKSIPVELDLGNHEQIGIVCRDIYARENHLDILVNCAAINREMAAMGMDEDVWRDVLGINLDGAFCLAKAAGQYMMLGRWGRIVNISSIAAVHGGRGQINYATAKAGIEAMTRVLALELGRKGILVNCVAPGVIDTEMSARVRRQYGEEILKSISVKRFGQPEEIAAVISFLVSDDAGYINGQTIRVDGGMAL